MSTEPQAADRRRADHGARRHGAEDDPGPAGQPHRGERPRRPAGHPRPGGRGRARGRDRRAQGRPCSSGRAVPQRSSPTRRTPTRRRCCDRRRWASPASRRPRDRAAVRAVRPCRCSRGRAGDGSVKTFGGRRGRTPVDGRRRGELRGAPRHDARHRGRVRLGQDDSRPHARRPGARRTPGRSPSAASPWCTTDAAAGQAALYRKVQMVYQDPFASLNPRSTVRAILDDPLAGHKVGGRVERSRPGSTSCWSSRDCPPGSPTATPPSSPVASASGWPSPVRSPRTRRSSCSTSRSRRST